MYILLTEAGPFAPNNTLPTPTSTSFGDVANATQALSQLGNLAYTNLTFIAALLAVLMILFSGIRYIIAGGDANRVKEARAGIINSVIGIIVVVASFFIVRFAISLGTTADQAIPPGIENSALPTSSSAAYPTESTPVQTSLPDIY